MNLRSAIKSIFGGTKSIAASSWQEIGKYNSQFNPYSTDLYANDICRASVRALGELRSRAMPKAYKKIENDIIFDQRLQKIIELRPNMYMNGKDFISKCSNLLEIHNTAFIYIQRDDFGKCIGLYPMPNANYEAMEYNSRLYIRFRFNSTAPVMVLPWDDLAVLRKDYNTSDIWGDSNSAISTSLALLDTTNQGMANAIKSTANLRGIVKSTKAMLSDDDVAKIQERFADLYMSLNNTSGIAALDSYSEFIPVNLTPTIANYKNIEELRNNIYRYFGVNDNILMSKATPEEWESFYEAKGETFLVALGQELTYKVYTDRERGFGNEIVFEANRMQYVSTQNKLNMVAMVDRGALTPNEWREIMNLAPIDGGDNPIRRLDTAPVGDTIPIVEEVDNDNEG